MCACDEIACRAILERDERLSMQDAEKRGERRFYKDAHTCFDILADRYQTFIASLEDTQTTPPTAIVR
jgi:hypothetical protein